LQPQKRVVGGERLNKEREGSKEGEGGKVGGGGEEER